MKKHIAPLLCAALLVVALMTTALADCPPDWMRRAEAAQQTADKSAPTYAGPYYPVSVEEYAEAGETRIRKTYQLSLSDDPSLIPTGDFTRDGRTYRLLDITQKAEVGVEAREHTETVTQDSKTGELSEVLKILPAEKKVTTKDGYSGTLLLDHTSIEVSVKGYQTSSRTLSAARTYPNLSDADVSLVPKGISNGGAWLTLADVQWSNDGDYFTATATYTGTASSTYATGYTVKANYTGKVAKTGCDIVTYTAVYGCGPETPDEATVEAVKEDVAASEPVPEDGQEEAATKEDGAEEDAAKDQDKDAESEAEAKSDVETEAEPEINPEALAKEKELIETQKKYIAGLSILGAVLGVIGVVLLVRDLLIKRKERKK